MGLLVGEMRQQVNYTALINVRAIIYVNQFYNSNYKHFLILFIACQPRLSPAQ